MWYFNDKYIHEKGYTLNDAIVLQLIHQNRTEEKEESLALYATDEMLEKFSKEGLIKSVKKKRKSDSDFSVLRLEKKGRDLLDCFGTPDLTEDSLRIFEWVKNFYKSEGKEIGNQKKCKMFIAQFSAESQITRNHLAHLIKVFLSDEKEMEFSHRMEYLFFKGSSVFSTKFDLHQSRLYQYYQKYEDKFSRDFANIKN